MAIDKSVVWYLAGPMSGYPSFNYPLFYTVAAKLRADGYQIRSPAEMDSGPERAIMMLSKTGAAEDLAVGATWGKFLSRDLPVVADECGGIIFLPEWWKSRGARLEATCGLLCGKKFAYWDRFTENAFSCPGAVIARELNEWLQEFTTP